MFKGLFAHLIAIWLHGHLNKNFPFCPERVLNVLIKYQLVCSGHKIN